MLAGMSPLPENEIDAPEPPEPPDAPESALPKHVALLLKNLEEMLVEHWHEIRLEGDSAHDSKVRLSVAFQLDFTPGGGVEQEVKIRMQPKAIVDSRSVESEAEEE